MNRSKVDQTLTTIEQLFQSDPGANLTGTGFWKAVAAVKRDPDLVDEFAERIARIDREGFQRWALITTPLGIGTLVALIGVATGLMLVGMAYSTSAPANGLMMLAGMFVIFTAIHGIGHLVVGRIVGIRFTHWFVGVLSQPAPGVKTDYVSYLSASPRGRAWMHAAGAIASKVVPFALIPAALAADVPSWSTLAMVGFGLLTIGTDVFFSTKKSDWKKFKREMAVAREG